MLIGVDVSCYIGWGNRELFFLLSFTCNYVVSVRREPGFLFPLVLGIGCVILFYCSTPCAFNIIILHHWATLKKARQDNRFILLYKGLKGKARIPTDDLIPKTRRCRNQHSI